MVLATREVHAANIIDVLRLKRYMLALPVHDALESFDLFGHKDLTADGDRLAHVGAFMHEFIAPGEVFFAAVSEDEVSHAALVLILAKRHAEHISA